MFSATSVLVLACAIALSGALPSTPPPPVCTPVQIGVATNHPVPLQTVSLQENLKDFVVQIPIVPECIYGEAGVFALACDFDVAPSENFLDFNNLIVSRHGSLAGEGTVKAVVYCITSPGPLNV